MSYAATRRRAGLGWQKSGLGVVYPAITNLVECGGGQYRYNQPPEEDQSGTREMCCPLSTWSESTVRAVRPDAWQVYIEDIVRKNVAKHVTKDGLDNAAYDLPMQYAQSPASVTYSSKLAASVDRASLNFTKLFQPRSMVTSDNGSETFCRSSGRYPLWTDPGNPDLALQGEALRDIFGREPNPAEVMKFYTDAIAMFGDVPRWFTANLSSPIPAEWGDGSWGTQPPSSNVGDFWWWNETSSEVKPRPWTQRFLDMMAPGGSGAFSVATRAGANSIAPIKSGLVIRNVTTPTTVRAGAVPLSTTSQKTSTTVVVGSLAVGVAALASLGYMAYRVVRR